MARKPNFKFERMERDRLKAAKKAEKARAKSESKGQTTEPESEDERAPDGA